MRTKLTQEVFIYCPIWAGWAAVDSDGCAHWFSHEPERENKLYWFCRDGCKLRIAGFFDATDWKNSLIKRQKGDEMKKKVLTKEVFSSPDCPKWAKWAAVDSDGFAYWYEEKPIPSHCGTFWVQEDPATKCMGINGEFSQTVDLIEREQSQTNLEWFCEHPDELAKKLIRFDYRKGAWLAPDGTEFYPSSKLEKDIIDDIIIRPIIAGLRCHDYTVNWLKQEHKENNND